MAIYPRISHRFFEKLTAFQSWVLEQESYISNNPKTSPILTKGQIILIGKRELTIFVTKDITSSSQIFDKDSNYNNLLVEGKVEEPYIFVIYSNAKRIYDFTTYNNKNWELSPEPDLLKATLYKPTEIIAENVRLIIEEDFLDLNNIGDFIGINTKSNVYLDSNGYTIYNDLVKEGESKGEIELSDNSYYRLYCSGSESFTLIEMSTSGNNFDANLGGMSSPGVYWGFLLSEVGNTAIRVSTDEKNFPQSVALIPRANGNLTTVRTQEDQDILLSDNTKDGIYNILLQVTSEEDEKTEWGYLLAKDDVDTPNSIILGTIEVKNKELVTGSLNISSREMGSSLPLYAELVDTNVKQSLRIVELHESLESLAKNVDETLKNLTTKELEMLTEDITIFVSGKDGDDTASEVDRTSKDYPFKTIQGAIDHLALNYHGNYQYATNIKILDTETHYSSFTIDAPHLFKIFIEPDDYSKRFVLDIIAPEGGDTLQPCNIVGPTIVSISSMRCNCVTPPYGGTSSMFRIMGFSYCSFNDVEFNVMITAYTDFTGIQVQSGTLIFNDVTVSVNTSDENDSSNCTFVACETANTFFKGMQTVSRIGGFISPFLSTSVGSMYYVQFIEGTKAEATAFLENADGSDTPLCDSYGTLVNRKWDADRLIRGYMTAPEAVTKYYPIKE